jgi:glycosyltransferase involved in cell wall biosynthesis
VTNRSVAELRTFRILQVAESYPPVYGGGAAIYVRDVSHALARRGHEVRVLSTAAWDAEPYAIRDDDDGPIKVRRVNLPYFRSADPDGFFLGLRKWKEHERRVDALIGDAVAEWRPDVVVYSATRPLGEQCLMTLRRHGLPVIGWLHEAWLICPRIMLLRSPTSEPCSGPGPLKCVECMYSQYDGTHMRAVAKLSWRVPRIRGYFAYRLRRRAKARQQLVGAIAVSEFMRRANQPHIPGPVLNVSLGVSLEGLPAERPVRPRKPFRFGFMGGFQPNKGIWDVLDAASTLQRGGFDFELHIWGPDDSDAREQITRRALSERIVLHGMYQAAEIWAAYDIIDLAIIATTVPEPLGRIPMEAAAAGVPTIGAKIGGITESIQHEQNGLLFEYRNAADLARQMQRVLEEPRLYDTLQRGLSAPVDTRNVGAAVESAYRELLANAAQSDSRRQ